MGLPVPPSTVSGQRQGWSHRFLYCNHSLPSLCPTARHLRHQSAAAAAHHSMSLTPVAADQRAHRRCVASIKLVLYIAPASGAFGPAPNQATDPFTAGVLTTVHCRQYYLDIVAATVFNPTRIFSQRRIGTSSSPVDARHCQRRHPNPRPAWTPTVVSRYPFRLPPARHDRRGRPSPRSCVIFSVLVGPPSKPCGLLRERWWPSASFDRHALLISIPHLMALD